MGTNRTEWPAVGNTVHARVGRKANAGEIQFRTVTPSIHAFTRRAVSSGWASVVSSDSTAGRRGIPGTSGDSRHRDPHPVRNPRKSTGGSSPMEGCAPDDSCSGPAVSDPTGGYFFNLRYASLMDFIFRSAISLYSGASPATLSGWYNWASFRYAAVISSCVAARRMSRTAYGSVSFPSSGRYSSPSFPDPSAEDRPVRFDEESFP
jgi:hypothetical protein